MLSTGLVPIESRGRFSKAGWNLKFPFEARDITIFWLFPFLVPYRKKNKTGWNFLWNSYEIEILNDFALIASEHPLCKDLFQHACSPHKVTMLHVRGIVWSSIKAQIQQEPFVFIRMMVLGNFTPKKQSVSSLNTAFLPWGGTLCWKMSTTPSPFPVKAVQGSLASSHMFAGAWPQTLHGSSKLFNLLSKYK